MNTYCSTCKNLCEEIIPTFNCNFQNMNNPELRIEAINEAVNNLHRASELLEILRDESKTETNVVNVTYQVPISNSDSLIAAYKTLPYNEKKRVYNMLFDLNDLGEAIDNKLILISLISSFVIAARKKNPAYDTLEAVKKLIDTESSNRYLQENMDDYVERLAIIADSFLFKVNKGNTFGLKSAAELKDKVNEILSNLLPF